MKKNKIPLTVAVAIGVSLTASADTSTTFGSLPGATFGSHGVANNAVEITTITGLPNSDAITLGLSANPRGALAPPVGNNGAGTFYAQPGLANGGALWDFNFDIAVANADLNNYQFKLFYGLDGTALASYSGLATIPDDTGAPGSAQNSENLSFAFLGTAIGFNPNAVGTYDFDLVAYNLAGTELGASDIRVQVPDSSSSLGLLAIALPALAFQRRLTSRRMAL